MAAFSLYFSIAILFSLGFVSSASSSSSSSCSSFCPKDSNFFLFGIQSQYPLSHASSLPIQVDGDFLDETLTSDKRIGYTSVLFYASWCPFSLSLRHTFESLSSLFPQIEHLLIEQSSALPSVLSRYGVRSFPSILLVNRMSRVRYHGPKDLLSLVHFYNRTTGLRPVQIYGDDQLVSIENAGNSVIQFPNTSTLNDILKREPYIALSVLFICLRVAFFILPNVLHQLNNLWVSYDPHLNLEIFGETRHLLGRVLQMVDIRRVWAKLRLCKTRNFHEGARNARVWASSFASVSLGDATPTRPA